MPNTCLACCLLCHSSYQFGDTAEEQFETIEKNMDHLEIASPFAPVFSHRSLNYPLTAIHISCSVIINPRHLRGNPGSPTSTL